jgi:hypothetical protein
VGLKLGGQFYLAANGQFCAAIDIIKATTYMWDDFHANLAHYLLISSLIAALMPLKQATAIWH